MKQLTRLLYRHIEHARDLGVVVLKDVLQQKYGAFFRRELLEDHEKRERYGFGVLQSAVRCLQL
jgi:hypothetical protein